LRDRLKDPKSLLLFGGLLLLTVYLLRSCIPALQSGVPPTILNALQTRYLTCVDDTPIWPGEPRQPECGQLRAQPVGEGTVPLPLRSTGVTKALCFRVTYTNPYWTTQGQTRHEIAQRSRTASKVALLRNGEWILFPDESFTDRRRWTEFACPGAYDAPASVGE
jgi:hypothetical protein